MCIVNFMNSLMHTLEEVGGEVSIEDGRLVLRCRIAVDGLACDHRHPAARYKEG